MQIAVLWRKRRNCSTSEANLRQGNLELEKQIAEAQKAVSEAEVRAAALEKEAETARLVQERLKGTVAWRILPPNLLNALTHALSSVGGSLTYLLRRTP
jgi:septal ring factor EnvC (AmiA/AmiB activator)